MYCRHCGKELDDSSRICLACGRLNKDGGRVGRKSKMAAGFLGVFLGGLGVHNFYLGYTGKAVAQIFVSMCTLGIGSLWGFIEGILIFAGSIDRDAYGEFLQN